MKIFKNFRFQIAFWFVALSFAVYLACVVFGGFYFYNSASNSLDVQLRVVASQAGHAIELEGEKPRFRDWLRVVETQPARSLTSMQLYDRDANLLEHYGPIGIPKLVQNKEEVTEDGKTMRVLTTPLRYRNDVVGYFQLQLPTSTREENTRDFLLTMLVMAPFVLIGFGLIGFVVSGRAVKPIERVVATLQQFVADAGHELNTPASIIQARAQTLERKFEKQGIIHEDLAMIIASAERMGAIVKSLMLLAELDGRHESKKSRSIDMKSVVSTVLTSFQEKYERKNILLREGLIESSVLIADQESLHCIVSNLLDNAYKYTDSAGSVTVSCTSKDGNIRFEVADTGIGIPEESVPFIFDRFYRVDKSRNRDSGGSGLGLSIVKAVVESLGGTVSVDSQVGSGSRFRVEIPSNRTSSFE